MRVLNDIDRTLTKFITGKLRVKPGDVVVHFKRELFDSSLKTINITTPYPTYGIYSYKVLGAAKHTETGELMMIYQALYDSRIFHINYGEIFVRPFDMFMSKVDKKKYPDIKQKYRFELLKNSTEKSNIIASIQ